MDLIPNELLTKIKMMISTNHEIGPRMWTVTTCRRCGVVAHIPLSRTTSWLGNTCPYTSQPLPCWLTVTGLYILKIVHSSEHSCTSPGIIQRQFSIHKYLIVNSKLSCHIEQWNIICQYMDNINSFQAKFIFTFGVQGWILCNVVRNHYVEYYLDIFIGHFSQHVTDAERTVHCATTSEQSSWPHNVNTMLLL